MVIVTLLQKIKISRKENVQEVMPLAQNAIHQKHPKLNLALMNKMLKLHQKRQNKAKSSKVVRIKKQNDATEEETEKRANKARRVKVGGIGYGIGGVSKTKFEANFLDVCKPQLYLLHPGK